MRAVPGVPVAGLSEREAGLLGRIGMQVHPLGQILRTRMEHGSLNRLVDRGLVQVSGVSPRMRATF